MKIAKIWIIVITTVSLISLAGTMPAIADDVTNAIRGALIEYRDNNYAAASEKLDYAAQLIRQKKGDQLKVFLPKALNGWTADISSSQTISVLMLGGGITAERQYTKGESLVTVKLVADAPMLRGVMMMFSNPLFLTSGGKMSTVKGQKAIIKYTPDKQSGEINVVADNSIMVTVSGENVTQQDLVDYAEKIDYEKLGKI